MNREQTAAINLALKVHIRLGNRDSHLLDEELALLRGLLERYVSDIEGESDTAVVFDGERLNPLNCKQV
jgi:hypothetical protein